MVVVVEEDRVNHDTWESQELVDATNRHLLSTKWQPRVPAASAEDSR